MAVLPIPVFHNVINELFYRTHNGEEGCRSGDSAVDLKVAEVIFDEDSIRLIHEIHERVNLLGAKGITLATLIENIVQYQKVSKLVITPDFHILFADYDNLEVKLTPLCKVLYIFYLLHPEGVEFKSLANYRDELESIYETLSPNLNPSRRKSHILRLTNPMDNSLNEKVSQIRRAFARVIDDTLLEHYIIKGEKGEKKTIALSPEQVCFVKNIK